MGSWSIWRVKQKSFVVLAVWKKSIMQLPKKIITQIKEWPPQHTEEKKGSNCSVEWSQSISSLSRAHMVATTHRDKRVWTKPSAQWETEQTNIWSSNESMARREIKQNLKAKKTKTLMKNEEENKSMADHQKHLRAERWTSDLEEQVYIPPEERQQPKSWEQTNKRRGKENKKN